MQKVYPINMSWDKNKNEKLVNRILWIVIILLLVIIIFEVIFQFLIAPTLKIKNIIIDSNLELSREEILHLAGIEKNVYYFSLNKDELERKIGAYPAVRKVLVEKRFPDTLKLVLLKRNPLAVTLINDKKQSIPALVDEQGVVFYIGKLNDEFNLPVISGLEFREYREGMKLPEKLVSFLIELSSLKEEAQALFNFISEIKVIPAGPAGSDGLKDFELVFYMIPYTTKIRFGKSINENILTYAMMVLDVLNRQGMSHTVKEIDFRSKEVVYRHQGGGDF